MMHPQITLEQWRSLIAVVEAGGYAQAAEKLYKSQSAVTYAVQKIETLLEVKAFKIQGRKAMLTLTGQMLYRRALALVEEAGDLESAAHALSAGWESVIGIASEILFPSHILLKCLDRFGQESPRTRVELIESVLGGTSEALQSGEVDLAISPQLPTGVLGELLTRIRLIAVAHADHPLNRQSRELTNRDLRAVTVEVDQRWTVSQVETSIRAVCMGYGFAWLPEEHIRDELDRGILRPLSLREGGVREIPLYLIVADPDFAGSGVRRLAEIIKQEVGSWTIP